MNIMPTLVEVAAAEYPDYHNGNQILPMEGASLVPLFRDVRNPERLLGFDHQGAKARRRGDWKVVWSKRMPYTIDWERYNLASDRCETEDLADEHLGLVADMVSKWKAWAQRVGVQYPN